MRTSGSECHSNQVDAEAMLRFVLRTLRQLLERHGNREKLRRKPLARARQARHADVPAQVEAIKYRMARERDDGLYAALARQYAAAKAEAEAAGRAVQRLEAEQAPAGEQAPEEQAESALALLDDVTRVTGDPAARAEVNPLLVRLGVRVGLSFGGVIKGKKRQDPCQPLWAHRPGCSFGPPFRLGPVGRRNAYPSARKLSFARPQSCHPPDSDGSRSMQHGETWRPHRPAGVAAA
jgi:hypothetical protein